MIIFEYGLWYLLQEQRAYFLESLEAGGLDISAESWPPDIIERNAQAGAESIMMFISHPTWAVENGAEVVTAIRTVLDKEPEFRALAYIYGVYELSDRIPPYGILQHAVSDSLMRVYCSILKKCLAFCHKGESVSQ